MYAKNNKKTFSVVLIRKISAPDWILYIRRAAYGTESVYRNRDGLIVFLL